MTPPWLVGSRDSSRPLYATAFTAERSNWDHPAVGVLEGGVAGGELPDIVVHPDDRLGGGDHVVQEAGGERLVVGGAHVDRCGVAVHVTGHRPTPAWPSRCRTGWSNWRLWWRTSRPASPSSRWCRTAPACWPRRPPPLGDGHPCGGLADAGARRGGRPVGVRGQGLAERPGGGHRLVLATAGEVLGAQNRRPRRLVRLRWDRQRGGHQHDAAASARMATMSGAGLDGEGDRLSQRHPLTAWPSSRSGRLIGYGRRAAKATASTSRVTETVRYRVSPAGGQHEQEA